MSNVSLSFEQARCWSAHVSHSDAAKPNKSLWCTQGPQILLVREGQGRAFTRNPIHAGADPKVEWQEVVLQKGSEWH